MNRTSLISTLLATAVLTSACGQDQTFRTIPNDAPIAIALIDNGAENAAEQRLGYIVQGEDAPLDGSKSFDPDDSSVTSLTYVWSFAALPEGSMLAVEDILIPEDDPETPDVNESAWASFTPDTLGTYRLELVVIDEDEGESAPAVVVVVSTPASNLLIQLDWDDTQADLDLHLIAPDGSYFGDGDCYSWNPSPNWGSSELANDNPSLSADDDGEGSGPYRESINLGQPEDGDYEVWVHYYSDHSQTLGNSVVTATPTITVSVFGETIWDASLPTPTPASPLVAGDVWKAGVISWPSRAWSPLGLISDHASEGGPAYNTGDGAGDGSN